MSTISHARRASPALYRSIVLGAPVSYAVYSAFSFYGSRRGGELPGPWLVRGLGALGHETGAIRQTLYRMEGTRELDSRAAGRVKLYRLSPYARAEAEAGLAKIIGEPSATWDGHWTLVHFRPGTEGRLERERLREIARAEGFASAGGGLFLHPRDRSVRLLAAASELGVVELIEMYRGRRLGGADQREFVARHWALDELARGYERFLLRYEHEVLHGRNRTDVAAFVLRFALVFDFLETAWQDPDLPPALLPTGWPGGRARRLARRLYRQCLPAALRFADDLMTMVRGSSGAREHRDVR